VYYGYNAGDVLSVYCWYETKERSSLYYGYNAGDVLSILLERDEREILSVL